MYELFLCPPSFTSIFYIKSNTTGSQRNKVKGNKRQEQVARWKNSHSTQRSQTSLSCQDTKTRIPASLATSSLSQLPLYLIEREVQLWKNKLFPPNREWLEMHLKETAIVVFQGYPPRSANGTDSAHRLRAHCSDSQCCQFTCHPKPAVRLGPHLPVWDN